MDDQKKPEENQEQKSDKSGEGDKYETTPVIERAREEREKLEAANKKKEELLDREESLMARKTLGGESEAGAEQEKKEDTPQQYAKDVIAGKYNGKED